MSGTLSLNPLQRLFMLRWVEVASQALVFWIVSGWLQVELPLPAMIALIGALAALNLLTGWRLRQPWPATDTEILAQIALDVAVLTALLYCSGGSTNPFASLLLMPLTIAATTLSVGYALSMAAITLSAYTLLLFYNIPLPPPQGELARLDEFISSATGVDPEHAGHGFALHVFGMWFNFLVSAAIVVFFVTRMALALRERERELSLTREAALRDEQILALGMLAAGAAHQLGTPLSTMAVIAQELQREHGDQPQLSADLGLLRQQVENCKNILSQLLASTGRARSEGGAPRMFDAYLREIIENWRLLRPQAIVSLHCMGTNAPRIMAERTLEQALLNLLDNACDASPAGIEVQSRWDTHALMIDILDRGPGLTPEQIQNMGKPFFTTKTEKGGLGLGVFLSNATLERLGGKVEIFSRSGGGACTRISLPLAKIGTMPHDATS